MKYFSYKMNQDEAKRIYDKLVKELHPDTNPNLSHQQFAEMKSEYEEYKIINKHYSKIADSIISDYQRDQELFNTKTPPESDSPLIDIDIDSIQNTFSNGMAVINNFFDDANALLTKANKTKKNFKKVIS